LLPFSMRILSQNLLKSCSTLIPSSFVFNSWGRPSYAACMLQNSVLPSGLPSRRGILMPYSTFAKAIVLL